MVLRIPKCSFLRSFQLDATKNNKLNFRINNDIHDFLINQNQSINRSMEKYFVQSFRLLEATIEASRVSSSFSFFLYNKYIIIIPHKPVHDRNAELPTPGHSDLPENKQDNGLNNPSHLGQTI